VDSLSSAFGAGSTASMMSRASLARRSEDSSGSSAAATVELANRSALRIATALRAALGLSRRVVPSTRRRSARCLRSSALRARPTGACFAGSAATPIPEWALQKSPSARTAAAQWRPAFVSAQHPLGPGESALVPQRGCGSSAGRISPTSPFYAQPSHPDHVFPANCENPPSGGLAVWWFGATLGSATHTPGPLGHPAPRSQDIGVETDWTVISPCGARQ
jgi:hypothetical protein